jgi:hypothetical protein
MESPERLKIADEYREIARKCAVEGEKDGH